MTPEQRTHLKHLMIEHTRLIASKYERGAVEHKTLLTTLTPLQLIDEAIGENIDQFAYLQTLRDNYVQEQNDANRLLRGL